MDKLQTIQIFIEVANLKKFSAAADKLGLSAPVVTRSIAELEGRLGARLINRTTRHVRLTEAGTRFLQDAQRIVEDLEDAEAAVKGIYTKPSGTLSVTAPVLFGEKHVMPIVTEYLEHNPEVSVKTMFYDRITSLVEEEFDVAIRIGHLKDSGLYAIQVGEVRRIVCGSPIYFEKYGTPSVPADLANHSIVYPVSAGNIINQWSFSTNGKKEVVKLYPRLRCNQIGSALKAAILGHGITSLLSYQVAEHIENGQLQNILTNYEEAPLPVNVVHLEGRRVNAKTRSFIDLAAKRLRTNPFINS
ncbi:LysR family transcriptional regulator [Vibrio vulnificus]|uniref:LysR family transcriptional regulator n=1 Tax=Vibrio vulnificus TaxID=672 RepID=UPI001029C0BC|nr:LysR family transcriptional regulator [Vibrio vulnificus]EGQ7996633.1 LysR family transcriptional regulator [Vibrio vulnificus]RZP71736.1 LysR family transcriptional regulator [Vibrio vulnificus]RZP71821.1 LysR family transcriptional regulator [Vibrio vulnificus]RZQ09572.1 LysR family transcriptional regulator [Vibrio vulnificus]